jgi:malic enzyme
LIFGVEKFIFPGVGLAAVAVRPWIITEDMFERAAEALSNCVSQEELKDGKVYPDVSNIRHVSLKVARAGENSILHFSPSLLNNK